MKKIYLAGGCFWGTEKYFSLINGVMKTTVGYANGLTENPTYEDVKYNDTGHAETVEVIYDDNILSLEKLLLMYYDVIDPTSVNKQGEDIGIQYRTGIYYTDLEQLDIINKSINELAKKFDEKISIEVLPLKQYFLAEEYHQNYLDKNPAGYCHIGKNKFEKARLS